MNESAKKILNQDIDNTIDSIMFECFIDIPQMFGLNINECHEYILSHILNRINTRHTNYIVEEEDD
jgi:hypothetical protein